MIWPCWILCWIDCSQTILITLPKDAHVKMFSSCAPSRCCLHARLSSTVSLHEAVFLKHHWTRAPFCNLFHSRQAADGTTAVINWPPRLCVCLSFVVFIVSPFLKMSLVLCLQGAFPTVEFSVTSFIEESDGMDASRVSSSTADI